MTTPTVAEEVSPAPEDDRYIPTDYVGKIPWNYYCRGWNAKEEKYCRNRAGAYTDHVGNGRCKFHGGNNPVRHGMRRRYEFTTPRIAELIEKHEADETPLDIMSEIALLRSLAEDCIDRYYPMRDAVCAWYAQRHLDPDQMRAMYELLDEFEAISKSGEMTDHQLELLSLARQAIAHLGEDIARPAQVPDIADAAKIVSEITKAVERVFNMRAKNAITYDQLRRFLFATERIIEGRIRGAMKDPAEADALLEKINNEVRGIRP